jgi:hypothetical protein
LLTDILTDPEWTALPMNRTRSPGGTTTVAPRPIPQVHAPITMGTTNAQISVAKYANDRHLIWHDAQTTFKSALIRSLGPTLEGAIGPPPDGFKMISPSQILAEVKLRYGTVDQVAFEKMEDILAAPLDNIQNLEKHIATQKKHMLMQTAAGYPIEEYRKVRLFRKSVTAHHQIAECMRDFDRIYPDPLLHTYDALISFIKTHLPNIRAAANLSSFTTSGKAFQAQLPHTSAAATAPLQMTMAKLQCAYFVLEYKHRALQNNRQNRPNVRMARRPGQTRVTKTLHLRSASSTAMCMARRTHTGLPNARSWQTRAKISMPQCAEPLAPTILREAPRPSVAKLPPGQRGPLPPQPCRRQDS